MKKILVPTDFSESAWNATRYVLELFKNQECLFYFLNTYTPPIASSRFLASSISGVSKENEAYLCSKKGLENWLERISDSYNNQIHYFKTISSFSFLVDEIREITAAEGIDLVVAGTKGASGLEEIFLGSNTVRMIKNIEKCPLLAVPQHVEFNTPNEFAFATDFNRFYTKKQLMPLVEMAHIFDAKIRIVYVQTKNKGLSELQQFNLSVLEKYLSGVSHYVYTVTEQKSVANTLDMCTRDMGVGLLAMLNYQHSIMEQITREPVVKRLAFHSQIPLLVIPELELKEIAEIGTDKHAVLREFK